MEIDYYSYWDSYGYDDYYCNDYYEDDRDPCWSYTESIEPDYDLISKNRGRYSSQNHARVLGKMIDMDTIYSREVLRERKIDQILGLLAPTYIPKATIGDFFPKNNN